MRRFSLGPGLCAAFGFTHLPAQAGKNLREPLAKTAIGAGHQCSSRPHARLRGRQKQEPERSA